MINDFSASNILQIKKFLADSEYIPHQDDTHHTYAEYFAIWGLTRHNLGVECSNLPSHEEIYLQTSSCSLVLTICVNWGDVRQHKSLFKRNFVVAYEENVNNVCSLKTSSDVTINCRYTSMKCELFSNGAKRIIIRKFYGPHDSKSVYDVSSLVYNSHSRDFNFLCSVDSMELFEFCYWINVLKAIKVTKVHFPELQCNDHFNPGKFLLPYSYNDLSELQIDFVLKADSESWTKTIEGVLAKADQHCFQQSVTDGIRV